MAKTDSSSKTSSDKTSKTSSIASSEKTSNSVSTSGTKSVGSSAPAKSSSLSSGSSKASFAPVSKGVSKNSSGSGLTSSASSSGRTATAPSKTSKSNSLTSQAQSGKRSTADPVVREGPSWDQFDDYVNNTDAFGRRSSDVGAGARLEDLTALLGAARLGPANPMALDTYGEDIPLNPLEAAMANGAARRAERAAAGVTPSDGWFDWNGLLYDMNEPYRRRQASEAEAYQPFNPLDVLEENHAIKLAEMAAERGALAAPGAGLSTDQKLAMIRLGVDPESGLLEDLNNPGTYYPPNRLPPSDPRLEIAGVTPTPVEVTGGLSDVPLPRRRPAYAGMGGIETVLPGQVEGGAAMSDEALYAQNHPVETPKEKTTWDNVVEMGGGLLEHTGLGGIVKGLFPDVWFGAGEAMKGIDGASSLTRSPGTHFEDTANGGSLIEQPTDTGDTGLMGFIDLNGNGIDDRLESEVAPLPPYVPSTAPNARVASFPTMPPYNPGRDNEWNYFTNNRLASGGIVQAYAEGGPVDSDPRIAMIGETEDVLEKVIGGEKPDEYDTNVLKKFVGAFGDGALRQLHDSVKQGFKMNGPAGGRRVTGPGGPTDDAIPAMIDGHAPAALSDGEYVFPAAAVAGAGGGDPDKGAEALQELSERLAAGMKSH